jgi:YggT family protein
MFVFGHLIEGVAVVIEMILNVYMMIIIAQAILSWVNPDPYNPIVRFIHNVTEPLLSFIRNKIPVIYANIDFSPIIVLLAIVFLRKFLVGSLYGLALTLM